MQEQIKRGTSPQESTRGLDPLKNKFSEIRETPIARTRIVKLRYESCCGCGCHDVWIKREVPADSPLRDGNYVKKILSTDQTTSSPW